MSLRSFAEMEYPDVTLLYNNIIYYLNKFEILNLIDGIDFLSLHFIRFDKSK